MKRITILFYLLIFSFCGICQTNTFPASGNVGIGTTTPTEKLSINRSLGVGYYSMLSINELSNNGNNSMGIDFKFGGASGFLWGSTGRIEVARQSTSANFDMIFHTAMSGVLGERMRILANGKVGIGTATPASLLDVFGHTAGGNVDINFRNQPGTNTSGSRTNINLPVFNGAPGLQISEMTASTGGFNVGSYDALISTGQSGSCLHLAAGSARNPQVTLKSTGNVGIGTTYPNAKLDVNGNIYSNGKIFIGTPDGNTLTAIAPYSLAVNGSAIFTKAVVKLNSAWPDYVFATDYKMPQLDSLEQFIKVNGHLPEIPKAEKVKNDGIDLGTNQALLLKKIEELTLIAIEQNKQTQSLQKIVENQKKEAQKLQKIVEEENKQAQGLQKIVDEQNKKIEELEAHLKK